MQNSRYRNQIKNFFVIAVLIAGFALRLYTTDFSREILPNTDPATYHYAAENLRKYGVLTFDSDGMMNSGEIDVTPTSRLMPGFPIFLYLVYLINDSPAFVYFVQVILSVLILLCIYLLLRKVGVSFIISLGILIIAAVYPAFCYNLDYILTETLFTALFIAFVYCLITFMQCSHSKKKNVIWLIVANLFLGSAVMVRAQALPFAIVECFLLLVYEGGNNTLRRSIKHCAVVCITLLLFMIPLWIRNWNTFHQFWLLTQAGDNPKIWGAQPYFIDIFNSVRSKPEELIANNLSLNSGTYWKWRIFGFFNYMWYGMWDEKLVYPIKFLKAFRLIHPLLIVPTVALIPLVIKKAKPEVLLLVSCPLVFSLMCMPFHGLPRYVFPAIPCVFVFGGILIEELMGWMKGKKTVTIAISGDRWKQYIDKAFRSCYLAFCIVFSLILVYSVYFFCDSIKTEMSNYYLEKTYHLSISDVEDMPIIEEQELVQERDLWYVVNAEEQQDNQFFSNWDSIPVMFVHIPENEGLNDTDIVTKVELDIPGGSLLDYCTIYWTGDAVSEYSESYVFGRFPRSHYEGLQTVYIPDNVNNLMIVPCLLRGSEFSVESIKVTKYGY